jgi:putative ABC transport system permease protein
VLLGAIAAARASRTYDNVVLRVLGASRGQLLLLQLAEYGALALVLALVALGLGSGLAWLVIVQLFTFDWLPDWGQVLAVLGVGLALVLGFALAGSLRCCGRSRPRRCASSNERRSRPPRPWDRGRSGFRCAAHQGT